MAISPICGAVMHSRATECHSCRALFGPGSAWEPILDECESAATAEPRKAFPERPVTKGETLRTLRAMEEQLRDETFDDSARNATRDLRRTASSLDTPFDQLLAESIGRLSGLAVNHRFSEALWEIDLMKSVPLDKTDVPRWDEDDFYGRIFPA